MQHESTTKIIITTRGRTTSRALLSHDHGEQPGLFVALFRVVMVVIVIVVVMWFVGRYVGTVDWRTERWIPVQYT